LRHFTIRHCDVLTGFKIDDKLKMYFNSLEFFTQVMQGVVGY